MGSNAVMTDAECFNAALYPIEDLTSPEGDRFIAQCRSELQRTGALALPSFVNPSIVERLCTEAVAHKSRGHRMQGEFSPYSDNLNELQDERLPADHPRRYRLPASHRFLAGDVFDDDSSIRRLYRNELLQHFLQSALNISALHEIKDELGCINVLFYEPGDNNGWHFDTTEFVISILLQAPESGGEYEFIPALRSRDNENLAAVAERMQKPDNPSGVQQAELHPGTLFLFRGEHTLHRVTKIAGERDRIVAILSYHRDAGHVLSEGSKVAMYGRAN
ncbi:MAG: hypothetical protein AAF420_04225 [Pseudomonadota bacterium]